MSVSGGITTNDNEVELTIAMSGGKEYKRIYNNVVGLAIDKFSMISSMVNKIISANATPEDIQFYVNQSRMLFRRAHVELLPGSGLFQNKYNMGVLDNYVCKLLETTNLKLIAQLLDLDSILYSVEEADPNGDIIIDFSVGPDLVAKSIAAIDESIEIASPITDELSAYLYSFNKNMQALIKVIVANKQVLLKLYDRILEAASKKLKKK